MGTTGGQSVEPMSAYPNKARDGSRVVVWSCGGLVVGWWCLCQPSRIRRGQGRTGELTRDGAVLDWQIPACARPNQVPSPNFKRDCPTHGCSAFLSCLPGCYFLLMTDCACCAGRLVSALTRSGSGRGPWIPQTRSTRQLVNFVVSFLGIRE